MSHNFKKRLDTVLDPTGNTGLSNTTFYSVDGDNADPGSDPNLPKATYSNDIPTIFAVIGGDQIYPPTTQSNKNIVGDGVAIIDGQGVDVVNTVGNLGYDSIHMRNLAGYKSRMTPATNPIVNCIFEGNLSFEFNVGSGSSPTLPSFNKCFFKNQNTILTGVSTIIYPRIVNCTFYSASGTHDAELYKPSITGDFNDIEDCVFVNMNVISDSEQIKQFYNCYFDNCTFEINGTPYADIATLIVAHPDAIPGYLESGIAYSGSLDRNEYLSVGASSTLIGAGRFGGNIGSVNEGLVFNETNPTGNTNITFVGGNITLTNPLVDGELIWQQSFSRVMSNPTLKFNGVPDFVNNIIKVVQVPDPSSPSKLTLEIETKDKTGSFEPIRAFSFNSAIGEDSFNLTSGEDEFHEIGLKNLRVFEVKVTMTIQA